MYFLCTLVYFIVFVVVVISDVDALLIARRIIVLSNEPLISMLLLYVFIVCVHNNYSKDRQ